MESTFAALGGWIFLGEHLSLRGLLGGELMLAGMVWSQIRLQGKKAVIDARAITCYIFR